MQWFRVYHGISTDPKLHKVARAAKVNRGLIIGAWIAILETASAAEIRGDASEVDDVSLGFMIDAKPHVAGRIIDALRRFGLLDETMRVAAWADRQKESDDSTERVRRFRARAKSRTRRYPGETDNILKIHKTDTGCNVSLTPPDTDTDIDIDSVIHPQQPESLTHARVAAAEEDRGRKFSDQPDRGDEAERREAIGTSPPPLVEVVDWDIAPPHDIQRSDIDPAIRRSLVEHAEMRGANPVTVGKRIDAWLRGAPPEFVESKIMRAVSDRSIRNSLGWIDRCVDDWIRAQHEQAEAAREKPFDPVEAAFAAIRKMEEKNAGGDVDRGGNQANSILSCLGEGRGSGGVDSASCAAR